MTLILDAAALIATERADRAMLIRLKAEVVSGRVPQTHAGVVAQVWRGGPRQARLARALNGMDVQALDDDWARRCGLLLGVAGADDVVDAGVAMLAVDGDEICTSDVDDIEALVAATGRHVEIIPV